MPRVVPSQVVAFIDQIFPGCAGWPENAGITFDQGPLLRAIRGLTEEIPEELIILEPAQYGALVASLSMLDQWLFYWQSGNKDSAMRDVPTYRRNPVPLIREVLIQCPDEAPSAGITGLEFIDVAELRMQLRIDMSTAFSAERNAEWKAATVLAGSVIEALLLWALEKTGRPAVDAAFAAARKTVPNARPFDEWTLGPFIEAASVAALVDQDTATQAKLAQNFRNLIHAGRAKRLGEVCNRGTALGALAAMERVATALKAKFPTPP